MARQTVLANNCSVASSLSWMLNETFWHYAFAGNSVSSLEDLDDGDFDEFADAALEDEDGCAVDEFADAAAVSDLNLMPAPHAVSALQIYPVDGSSAAQADDWTTVFSPVHQFGTNTLFGDVLGECY